MGNLEIASPANAAEAIAYLSRAPYENVYVQWLLESGQLEFRGPGVFEQYAGNPEATAAAFSAGDAEPRQVL